MPRSKFLLVLTLLLLLAVPATVVIAQATPVGEGSAVVFDDAAVSDGIEVNISGATPAAEGMEYVAWLVADEQSGFLRLGSLDVDASGNANLKFGAESANYVGANLIAMYSGWVISVEQAGSSPDRPTDQGIASETFTAQTAETLRMLIGAGANLNMQLEVAEMHAQLAASSETLEGAKMHAQHVINILEGSEGANYMAEGGDPGDGVGALAHAAAAKAAAMRASSMPRDGSNMAMYSSMAATGFGNAEMWMMNARDAAVMALGQDSLQIAQIFIGPPAGTFGSSGRSVVAYLDVAANGFDVNGDGMLGQREVIDEDDDEAPPMIVAETSEHGAMMAYENSQKAATLSVVAGGLPILSTPTPTPAPTATPTPTPLPTATPTPTPVQPTAPGLPGVGDASASAAIQLAALIAFALLAVGGVMSIRGRRSRNKA